MKKLIVSVLFAWMALPLFGAVVCYEYMTITPASGDQTSGVHVLTDYVPKSNAVVRTKFASSSSSNVNNNQFLFCSRLSSSESTGNRHFSFAANVGSLFRWDYYGTFYRAGSSFAADADYEVEVKNGQATVTKVIDPSKVVTLGAASVADFEPAYKMALFQSYAVSGDSYASWGNSFHGKFYGLKVFEIENDDEVLKHWFVPCTDDGVVKICDLADGKRLYDLVVTGSGTASVEGAPAMDIPTTSGMTITVF